MKRLSVGVDVSKKTLDVAYWAQHESESVFVGKFANNHKGFQAIQRKMESGLSPQSNRLVSKLYELRR